MAYVDFARDCFRPQAEIQAIPSNGDVHDAAAYRASMVRVGSGGKSNLFSPGRLSVPFAETKGTCNCTELFGNVHTSMLCGSVTRWFPQSLRDSSLPEGAHVHADGVELYRCSTGDSFRHPLKRCHLPQGGSLRLSKKSNKLSIPVCRAPENN